MELDKLILKCVWKANVYNQDRIQEFVLPNINMYYEAMKIKAMWNVVWLQEWKNTVRKESLKTSPLLNRKA